MGKTHETPQEPQLAHSYKSVTSFTINKEEFPPLSSVSSPLGSFNHLLIQLNQVHAYKKVLKKMFFPLVNPIFIILCQVENRILGLKYL